MARDNNLLHFHVSGMDCAEEVAVLKRTVGPLVGGEQFLSFDVLRSKMTVQASPELSVTSVREAVEATGMRIEVWNEQRGSAVTSRSLQTRLRQILVLTSGVSIVLGFSLHAYLAGSVHIALGQEGKAGVGWPPFAVGACYAFAALAGVWLVLPKAGNSLRQLRPDMNLLMVVAVCGALLIGEWLEAATVAFLFAISNLLESWSVERARRAISSLLDASPQTITILNDNRVEQQIAPEQIMPGTLFIVRAGERLPLDGRIVRGSSHLNEAPITGESQPKAKSPGDIVFAGTVNGNGVLEVECTAKVTETTLARIIRLVEQAQSRRAPSEQWVESFARIYTPTVMLMALCVVLVQPLVFQTPWTIAIYSGLVLLVIACPCALVISTPVSIVAGLTTAASRGILIKGGAYLEIPAKLSAIAFDKTGTLTLGKPVVVAVVPLSGHTEIELLERAAAMEARSDHPLARAILLYAEQQGVPPLLAEDIKIVPGKGATAIFNGKSFWIGSHKYLEERRQETSEIHNQLESMASGGQSVIVVGNEQHVCGLLAVADQIRPQSHGTMKALRAMGIRKLIMLTGDNHATASAIATQAGLDDVQSELLPQDKVATVAALVAQFGAVAMVGDGINDAPALATATLGIAMGAAGSVAALETADIALMSDDLSQLPWLIQHSRRTLRIIRQNIYFSLGIKLLFVMLTFLGYSSLWAAIAADMGASLLVIFNGLRLLQWQRPT